MLSDFEFWRRLSERIADQRAGQIERLTGGHLTLEEYKLAAGHIAGLDFVAREAKIVHDDMMGIVREPKEPEEE